MQTRLILAVGLLLGVGLGIALLVYAVRTQPLKVNSVPSSSSPTSSPTLSPSSPSDRAIRSAEASVTQQPEQSEGYIALATAYMQKARESGDTGYYLRAEAAVQRALHLQADSAEGLRTLVWVQTGKHEFRQALATAERLLKQTPHDPLVYGLLADAAVELGEYERAAEALAKMVDLRPDLASYSRLSYLHELHGDLPGATDLMMRAVKAGSSRDPEPLAWCLVQLGNLYF